MISFRRHAPSQDLTGLDLWLNKATQGLAQTAKARVEAEVRAHVEQAVEAALAQGAARDAALAAAVADLGPAMKARVRFYGSYMTAGEEEFVRILNGKTPFIEVPQPCWPIDWIHYIGAAIYLLMGPVFIAQMLAPHSWGRLVRHFMRHRPQREIWRCIAAIQFLFIPLYCLGLVYRTSVPDAAAMSTLDIAMTTLNLSMMCAVPFSSLRIASKLPRDKNQVKS